MEISIYIEPWEFPFEAQKTQVMIRLWSKQLIFGFLQPFGTLLNFEFNVDLDVNYRWKSTIKDCVGVFVKSRFNDIFKIKRGNTSFLLRFYNVS